MRRLAPSNLPLPAGATLLASVRSRLDHASATTRVWREADGRFGATIVGLADGAEVGGTRREAVPSLEELDGLLSTDLGRGPFGAARLAVLSSAVAALRRAQSLAA